MNLFIFNMILSNLLQLQLQFKKLHKLRQHNTTKHHRTYISRSEIDLPIMLKSSNTVVATSWFDCFVLHLENYNITF